MSAHAATALPDPDFVHEVCAGLSRPGQKELPSKYLYDTLGSALFEAITHLPEYGLTRADERLLRRYAGAIIDCVPGKVVIAELGSGSGRKARWILEAVSRRGPAVYYPIDISGAALTRCAQELSCLGSIGVVGLEKPFIDGLREVAAHRQPRQTLLVLFLGSTIGNLDRAAGDRFLREIRRCLRPGDGLLLGADLLKPLPEMLMAYDDPTGVTAAFNLNLLARINRELGGDFVLRNFEHHVRYDTAARRVEMHLLSRRNQRVRIRSANFEAALREGETIWTESCHKFEVEEIADMAARTGFACEAQWIDGEWAFAESLWIAVAERDTNSLHQA